MRMLQTHMSIHDEREVERGEPPPVPDSAGRTPPHTQVPSSITPQCHESAHRSVLGANTAAVAAGVDEACAGGAEGEGVGGASTRARVLSDEAYIGEHTRVAWQCPYPEASTEAEVFWLAVCIGDHLALQTMLMATTLQ